MLPWSIYSTFAIEGKYGFNTTTIRTFVSDRVKGLFLTILIGGPVLLVIISIFEYGGTMAWFYCWISVTLISVSMMFVAPTWIMPLFNKFTPMEPGELKESIVSYSNSVDFHVKDIFVIDGSKRSTKANAFFTGFGRNKRIALFDTLVENHPSQEIVAVVSRKDELDCDLWAVDTGAGGEAMVSALRRLSANNLSNLTPHPLMVFVQFDHPTLLERVNAIHSRMKTL